MPWSEGQSPFDFMIAHTHFTLITLLILVLNSHVQIALRFASPGGLPAVWWGASRLASEHGKQKNSWLGGMKWMDVLVTYLVLWNLSSAVLSAGFYPPA
jgi:phosphatidylinositol glycan class V